MFTDKMREAFGYDMLGNSPTLVAAADEVVLERGINRAAGTVMCSCGVTYNLHPPVQGALWATRTCEGIFKL